MGTFVWTKMGAEGGQSLPRIIALKEAERQAGSGVFWWGIGNSLGVAVHEAAAKSGGTLPVIFSTMLTRHKRADSHPNYVCVWEHWQDQQGIVRPLPPHVLEWSRGNEAKKVHYALVCRSTEPLSIADLGQFDPSKCKTVKGKSPGGSQVTALLEEDASMDHSRGEYHRCFKADLVEPWVVKLVRPRRMSQDEQSIQNSWRPGGDWLGFVGRFRSGLIP